MIYKTIQSKFSAGDTYIEAPIFYPNPQLNKELSDVTYEIADNVIIYYAASKLVETTSDKSGGLHTNRFYTTVDPTALQFLDRYALTSIKSHTFENGKGIIEFEDPIGYIAQYAFYLATSMSGIILPTKILQITSLAFDGCSGIRKVIIPSVKAWCSINFANKTANPICCTESVSGHVPVRVYKNEDDELVDVVILGSTGKVSNFCFDGAAYIKSVTIEEGVTEIGGSAFLNCSSLTDVSLPTTLLKIDTGAVNNSFDGCYNLPVIDNARYADTVLVTVINKSQTAPIKLGTRLISKAAFLNYSAEQNIVVPETVISLGDSCFSSCNMLSIVINNPDAELGLKCFENCTQLASITLPSNLKTIPDSCFKSCTRLTQIEFPESLTTIGLFAFSGASALFYLSGVVTFPKNLEDFGLSAMDGNPNINKVVFTNPNVCPSFYSPFGSNNQNMREIRIYATSPTLAYMSQDPFAGCSTLLHIYVPADSVDIYKSTAGWSTRASIISAIPEE